VQVGRFFVACTLGCFTVQLLYCRRCLLLLLPTHRLPSIYCWLVYVTIALAILWTIMLVWLRLYPAACIHTIRVYRVIISPPVIVYIDSSCSSCYIIYCHFFFHLPSLLYILTFFFPWYVFLLTYFPSFFPVLLTAHMLHKTLHDMCNILYICVMCMLYYNMFISVFPCVWKRHVALQRAALAAVL
jgi:hypothetical protein